MESIKFEGSNHVWAENQSEYNTLPALLYRETEEDAITSLHCFKLSPVEVAKIVATGKIWHRTYVGKNLLPFSIHAVTNFIEAKESEELPTVEEIADYPETKYEMDTMVRVKLTWKNALAFLRGNLTINFKNTLTTKGVLLTTPDLQVESKD